MPYEVNYQETLKLITKLEREVRQVMKGFYKRELENQKMRKAVIAVLDSPDVKMDQLTRAMLLESVNYTPWTKARKTADKIADETIMEELTRDNAPT